jgi:hypothetical protein
VNRLEARSSENANDGNVGSLKGVPTKVRSKSMKVSKSPSYVVSQNSLTLGSKQRERVQDIRSKLKVASSDSDSQVPVGSKYKNKMRFFLKIQ